MALQEVKKFITYIKDNREALEKYNEKLLETGSYMFMDPGRVLCPSRDVCVIAVHARKGYKNDKADQLSLGVLGVKIALVHGVIQAHAAQSKGQLPAVFAFEPVIRNSVDGLLDGLVPFFEGPVLVHGHACLGGLVHIGPHLGDFSALHGKFGQVEPSLLTAFDGAEAEPFIVLKIAVGDAHKNQAESTVFTEVSELLKQRRKVGVGTDGVAAHDHHIVHNAVGHNTVYILPEIQGLVILQRQV